MASSEYIENCKKAIPEMLNYIPVSELDYNTWLYVGMALHHEGYPCSIWDDWSKSDSRYNSEDFDRKWKEFGNSTENITGATITKLARKYGWSGKYDKNKNSLYNLPTKPITPCEAHDEVIGIKVDLNIPDDLEELVEPKEWHQNEDLIAFLQELYKPDEIVRYCTEAYKKDNKWNPNQSVKHFKKCSDLIYKLESGSSVEQALGNLNKESGAWVQINPSDGIGAKKENVIDYRYALVECDHIPVEEQIEIYKQMNLPIATLTYSGNKSVHAIVKVDASSPKEYTERVKYLFNTLQANGIEIDTANKNCNRLTRIPSVIRGNQKQFLITTNIGCINWDEWIQWLENNEKLSYWKILQMILDSSVNIFDVIKILEKLPPEDAYYLLMARRWLIPNLRKEQFISLICIDKEAPYLNIALNNGLDYKQFKKALNSSFSEKEILELVLNDYDIAYNESIGFFEYTNGYWNKRSDTHIKNIVSQYCGDSITGQKLTSLLNLIKTELINDRLDFNTGGYRGKVLNFANGTLEIETGVFREPRRSDYQAYKLDYPYNENASSENVLNFLKDVLENEQDIHIIQEYLGYCLFSDCQMEKVLFLIGNGANGKTIFEKLVSSLFGKNEERQQNEIPIHLSMNLEKMGEKFHVSRLYGKRINIISEIDSGKKKIIPSGTFKNMASGETLTGEEKNKQPFEFNSVAKCIVACNEMPIFQDYTDGTKRRLLIVPFPYHFVRNPTKTNEKAIDTTLDKKLINKENLSGFFNWVYEGYLQLKENGKFSESKNTEIALNEYIKDTDVVYQFFLDEPWKMYSQEDKFPTDRMYSIFNDYCKNNGFRNITKPNFCKRFKKIVDDEESLSTNGTATKNCCLVPVLKYEKFYDSDTGKQVRGYIVV